MEYIDIEKDSIPYQFEITLVEETFTFTVNYNSEYDFFTVDLSKGDEVLALGEKIVYGSPLFSAQVDSRFPKNPIIPLDASGKEDRVTYENLGSTVFLYVFGEDDLL